MKIRNIPFGYEIKNGEIRVDPIAEQVVREIYIDYMQGKSFSKIADKLTLKKVDYYEGKTTWNKMMVKRVLEFKPYTGDEKYPPIIEEEQFNTVSKLIASKYGVYNKDPRATFLKKKTFCQECGERVWRDINKVNHYAWKCKKCQSIKMQESDFYQSIVDTLNSVIANPELLDEISVTETYEAEYELVEKAKNLTSLLNSPNVEFGSAFESILELASEKYDRCEYDISAELTETIKSDFINRTPLEDIDIELLERTVSHITIDRTDKIAIHFINGAIVRKTRRLV